MIQVGDRFGRLVVLERVGSEAYPSKEKIKKRSLWRCRCDCGTEKVLSSSALQNTKSCGCLIHDVLVERNTTHGLARTRLYKIYNKMKERCYNENATNYERYGGRGIVIRDEWLDDFKIFYDWSMENGYSDELTIDRIDVNGNYSPENCRWCTYKQQNRNRRNTVYITVNGEKKSLKEWAEIIDIPYSRMFPWVQRHGETVVAERICDILNGADYSDPIGNKPITFNGKSYKSHKALAEDYGISHKLLHDRMKRGWCIEEALGIIPHKRVGHKYKGKPAGSLLAIDDEGHETIFDSMAEMASLLNVDRSSISHAIHEGWRIKGYRVYWEKDYKRRGVK